MNKEIIKVPFGVRFISEWKDYALPEGHCIIDKGVTGCGYTELGLTNENNVILCSPRKLLLENKAEKHENDENILYLENKIVEYGDIDYMTLKISDHIINCRMKKLPIKFMITYDSAHYVIDYLEKNNQLDNFYLIADEFQSIFLDSYFKAEVENSFIEVIQKCKNIIYLSATPMLDKYLEQLDEFKDLKFYHIDWSDSGYVETIKIQRKHSTSLSTEAVEIVKNYLSGNFPVIVDDNNKIVKSTEAVFYFNSVTEIIRVINKCGLSPEQVNIICSDTDLNRRKLKKINHDIGKIPMEGQPNKMFTFCTSTCYIGADFYSKCASTFIFADPNLKCLALDISLDLPQIAGRQRDRENPFKNNITIFYKTTRGENIEDRQAFEQLQKERRDATEVLLSDYNNMSEKGKVQIIKKYRDSIEVSKYSDDFLGISSQSGKPVYNRLIEIANERAWEVSQKDYQDSISLTRSLKALPNVEVDTYKNEKDKIIQEFLDNHFYATGIFADKLKMFCNFMDEYGEDEYINMSISFKITDSRFNNYYRLFNTDGCRAMEFRENRLLARLSLLEKSEIIEESIYNIFEINKRYSLKDIKSNLEIVYRKIGLIDKKAKASDLGEWFELKKVQIFDSVTKEKENGFEILSKK